jgi:hypothetical protein
VKRSHHRMRMILIPLAAAVAIVITAMTRRPGLPGRQPAKGK